MRTKCAIMQKASDVKEEKGIAAVASAGSAISLHPISGPEATLINEKLKELYHSIHQAQDDRSNSANNLSNISKAHERMQSDPSKPYIKSKLKGLYKSALSDAITEADSLRKCLSIIADIRSTVRNRPRKLGLHNKETSIRRGALMKMLQQNAQTLPLFIARSRTEKPPPLCGCTPADGNYVAKPGDMVAAIVKGAEGDESNWILAEVVHYNSSTSKYEIDDIDEEQKERHNLSKRRVVPLAVMRANPETHPEALFEKGTDVLALYPQTTCFYKGVIHETPKTPQEEYQVLFEDPR